MQSLTRLAGRTAGTLALAASVAIAGEPARAAAPPGPGFWHTVALPVPVAALCQAADLPEPSAPEHLLFDLIRVLHERPLAPSDFERGRAGGVLRLLRSAAAQPSTPPAAQLDAFVPLPLAPATWTRAILKRRMASPALIAAILADRRASLLYVGLSQVDAETLDALERTPEIFATLDERRASALAAFGGSLAIHRGVVRVPGADESQAAWETLVGAPVSDAARFVPALLERDRGRLAYFFDTLTRLGAAHLRFAVGAMPDAASRLARLTSLYDVFRRASPEWDAAQYPFYRPAVDLATVLSTLRVTPDGRLAPPSSRSMWELAFRGQGSDLGAAAAGPPDEEDVDAVWLLDMILADGPRVAPGRVAQVRFAQRVFAKVPLTPDARQASGIAAYPRVPALMLTLERLGIAQPATYERARRVAAVVTRRDSEGILALFQACLALIDRAAWVRSLEQPEAERLAESLLALNPESPDYDVRLADWVSAVLLPAIAEQASVAGTEATETIVLRALAGGRDDVAAHSVVRLQRLRERQGPPRLDQALGLYKAVEAIAAPNAAPAATASVSRLLAELHVAIPDVDQNRGLREAIVRARTSLSESITAGSAMRLSGDARRDLARARLAVLADTLVALAYLPSLGDPDGPARLGGHVARRHLFTIAKDLAGDDAEPAWRLPREIVTPERGWHVEGSLLGLHDALARLTLKRLAVDVIPAGPRLDETTRRRFVIDAARTRAFDLADTERDLVASGLRAGRARIARLGEDAEAIADLAASIPLDARRVQALRWILDQGATDLMTRFSFGEILRAGAPQPLPFDVATIPSAVCPRGSPRCRLELTDLTLRLVERLADRQLPVALLPGVLAAATQDFIDEVQPVHAEDVQALWRYVAGLSGDRIDDYVAAAADALDGSSSDLRGAPVPGVRSVPVVLRWGRDAWVRSVTGGRELLGDLRSDAWGRELLGDLRSSRPQYSIRIVSPVDGAYLSGIVALRAEVTPSEAVREIQEVTFAVDGRVVCRLPGPPLVCEWDAGRRIEARVIRVVATLKAGRVTDSVRTRRLELAEVVDVDAVQVIAVVADEQGKFVKGLPREAFRVYEDEVPQTIAHFAAENIPLELTAAIDISGSMKMAMPQVKAAARRFLLALQPGHEVTLVAFNENLFVLARRGTDPKARTRAVDRLAAWGSTALYDAILYGFDLLSRRPGRRAIVVFTDGDDKVSHAPVSSVVRRAESSDAALYMIGQGQAAENESLQALLTRLATISGGRAFFDTSVESLQRVFDEILADLSHQYLLSYQPKTPVEDDRWRSIRVEVDGPGYRVRARQGYRRGVRP